jgi:DNA-binding GntR family transcriptional regulator
VTAGDLEAPAAGHRSATAEPTLAALTPTPRVADSVHERLREAILKGHLAPGSRLSVPLLAQQLEVSRSPVREAVQRLVQEGLATEEPHRGAGVAMVDPAEVLPAYEIREVLEGLAARLAAQQATPGQLAALRSAHDEHAAALDRGDASRHVPLDMAFHAALRSAAQNRELSRYLDQVQGRIAIAMLGGNPQAWSSSAIAEHQAILDAVLARDADGAEAAARAHVRRVRAGLAALHAGGAEPA